MRNGHYEKNIRNEYIVSLRNAPLRVTGLVFHENQGCTTVYHFKEMSQTNAHETKCFGIVTNESIQRAYQLYSYVAIESITYTEGT